MRESCSLANAHCTLEPSSEFLAKAGNAHHLVLSRPPLERSMPVVFRGAPFDRQGIDSPFDSAYSTCGLQEVYTHYIHLFRLHDAKVVAHSSPKGDLYIYVDTAAEVENKRSRKNHRILY